jgi:hypothetical protein
MSKINKTHIAQLTLIAFLAMALIVPISAAHAVTIALQGQIDPANIDISIDKATLNLDIATGLTQATDTITVSSTAVIPVVMSLESVSHKAGSWSPTLISADPTTLGLTDAQTQARLTLNSNTANPDYSVAPPATVTPTGTGATVDGTTYPVALGTIADSDGVTAKEVIITGQLEVNNKRILSKAFDSEMVLNFTAAE